MKPSCVKVRNMLLRRWMSNFDLIVKCGVSALSRVRELRYRYGYPVEMKRGKVNGEWTNTYYYRIKYNKP